jgi:hypothetical protein
MRALKLVQHLRADADRMSERVIEKIRNSRKCNELLLGVPAEEQKRCGVELFRDLMD